MSARFKTSSVSASRTAAWWRRRRLDEYPTGELPDQVVADHARESDMAEVVRRALDRLPQRMRAAVMLRYFEDMTEPEIAATLGISLGTVKSTVSRGVATLRIDAELAKDSGAFIPDPRKCREPLLCRFAAIRGRGGPGAAIGTAGATAGYLTHGTIRYAGQAPSRRWLGAEHNDGCPADDYIDHAVRNVCIRRPG